jgi:hypothetical protein
MVIRPLSIDIPPINHSDIGVFPNLAIVNGGLSMPVQVAEFQLGGVEEFREEDITWLVGGLPTPLKNMKVSWDDFSQLNGTIKFMFQATNQMGISWDFTDKKYVMKILMKSSNHKMTASQTARSFVEPVYSF